ncbi:MAG: hypothetical protein QNJ46_04520 [Leptolyngbyaceae cyanobacterium MO_188.B28]|nr:hypothetical protein [Leptolyngbyaceae cyanobacterium MO_188.B28]
MERRAMTKGNSDMGDRRSFCKRQVSQNYPWRQLSKPILALVLVFVSGCSGRQAPGSQAASDSLPDSAVALETHQAQPTVAKSHSATAEVVDVSVSGEPNAYRFSVTIRSPDTGCEQYADWWEVLTPEGLLRYRRILLHSHVNEQPFTRSGGPAPIQPTEEVIVRAHMHPSGYGASAQQGSVETGFTPVTLPVDFAADLAEQSPQPSGCNF